MIRTYFHTIILLIVTFASAPVSAQAIADRHVNGTYLLAQSEDVRSRSEVVREVKERYNAKVLRIELSRDRSVYQVRILLPNGKVRDISVRAQR